jgi:hypothetical protein
MKMIFVMQASWKAISPPEDMLPAAATNPACLTIQADFAEITPSDGNLH